MKKAAFFWLLTNLLTALAVAAGHPRPGNVPDAAAKLSPLEVALAADPDNLHLENDYRMAAIATNQYDRCIKFFGKLVQERPYSSNLYLNYAFAYVDKIPVSGTITKLIAGNDALNMFTKSIQLKPSWIGYFARGKTSLFWPSIFDRTRPGVADLERAMKIQKAERKRRYHVYTYVSLGDGYWKLGNLAKATGVWKEGLAEFPDNADLKARLSRQGAGLKALIEDALDYNKRVDTNLQELWGVA
jgi:tetratricopeptide (TPR) repeat protein